MEIDEGANGKLQMADGKNGPLRRAKAGMANCLWQMTDGQGAWTGKSRLIKVNQG
jgi:hypothetical protein